MLQKIQEQTAVNEARMDMALTNVDTQGMKIEEEAEKIRANELLKQFKQEMGMEAPAAESGGGDKTLGKKVGVQ
jgi:phage shock protein A